ncbi:hypothetical protein QN277_007828 [Acacia crassicarpa]|uniref:Uncharacterized protein n=1 Tax=Acacia crassicarpa TaxID=499986 RepID=A0AAE1MAF1_9FABA|nr:hypothetical protein QN277_007828 [Acacia crassicarpa]
MDFFEDWKSHIPVSPFHERLLVSDSDRSALGPLIFNPNPQTLTQLFSSSSLLIPPICAPQLSLPQFLATATPDAPILPSTASSIASQFGSQLQDDLPPAFRYNQLEILKYQNGAILFFPTGENLDQVGYLTLFFEDSHLRIKLDNNEAIFQVSCGASDHILRILVNSVVNRDECSLVGYLLVTTCYAVYWFSVEHDSHRNRPRVVLVGNKTLACSVVHACWSPHIFEESLVLLENGYLFLFDSGDGKAAPNFKGTGSQLKCPSPYSSKALVWVSCEFSWKPRIFIVATSEVVFLVDWTEDTHVVSCLLTVDLLHTHPQNEEFLALSRAGPDNLYFIVASNNFLLLCDVRKEMMPIIQWDHDLENATYINVLNLFQLRSHSRTDTFDSASKAGFCIILGSFFNESFNLFCYGSLLPSKEGSFASEFSKTSKTIYAWERPYELAISGHYCRCGSCLLKEEYAKENLPKWIDWRTKKEMILGFSILNNNLASKLCEQDKHGGFTLIRLMSSGKLELQRYQASWVTEKKSKNCNGLGVQLNGYLFSTTDEKYECSKSFTFLRSNYLNSHFRGNLTECLVEKIKGTNVRKKKSLDEEVHKALCEKLNACGVGFSKSSRTTIYFFNDVMPSASLYEVALRGLWAKLPLHILQLAFSKQSESCVGGKKKVSLEFLVVPPHNNLPPFFLRKPSPHSKKCSGKGQCQDVNSGKSKCNDDIVGPILPLAILVGLHKIGDGSSDLEDCSFSVETEIGLQCKEVMKVAGKISVSAIGSELFDDLAVSPGDRDPSTPKPFVLYHPNLFDCPVPDLLHGNFVDQYKIHHTLAFNAQENKTVPNEKSEAVGQGIVGDISPAESRSHASDGKFGPCDLKAYDVLKTQMSRWKKGFDSYKKICIQTKIQKAINK